MSFPVGVLSAQQAIAAARAMQSNEREALREAGRKKLDEYRKLKASVMNDIENKLSSFTTSNAPTSSSAVLRPEQDPNHSSESGDPMVDVLLAQVSSLMADKQRLTALCGSLQRENEQLVELVGYLSLEQQQMLEEQQQLPVTSDEGELEGTWYSEQQQLREDAGSVSADDDMMPMHLSSDSDQSTDVVVASFAADDSDRGKELE